MPFKKPDFTIDDAFSESAEDKIRLYTRTSESVPLTEETIQVQFKWIIYLNIDSFNTWLPRAYTVHMLTHIRKSPLVFLTPQARLMILRTSLSALPPQQHLQLSKPKLFKIPPYRSQFFLWQPITYNFPIMFLQALKSKAEDSTSQDSTSLLPTNPGYYSGQEPTSKAWYRHPKIR